MKVSRGRMLGMAVLGVLCGVMLAHSQEDAVPVNEGQIDVESPDAESFETVVGRTAPIRLDDNPMVASVAEAVRGGKHPERLSAMIVPEKFDENEYKASREVYLNTVEPGRIWLAAQPREGVTPIQTLSPTYVSVLHGEPVVLKVQAAPESPVTFTSFDLGAFSNKLTSITVEADKEGVAVASFVGTPGTYNEVNILAASPATSGQARFVVNVVVPRLNEIEAAIRTKVATAVSPSP